MASVKIPFRYGRETVEVDCDEEDILAIVTPGEMPEADDEIALVRDALQNPIGTKRLSTIAKPGDAVAIVADDFARPVTGWKVLPPVLEELERAGVRDEDITIMMGSGTHRPCTREECERLVGKEVVERFKVVSHDMDDQDNLVFIGMTSGGNSVWVNRLIAHADVKVLTGHIALIGHGFSGGRKSLLPAVCGRDTIYFNHRHEWISRSFFGKLENNPMHDDSMEAAHLGRIDFIVNVVLNVKREVIKAVAGDMVLAWMEGVSLARELYTFPLDRQPEIVMTSAGGSPSDDTLYQAVKGIQISYPLIKQGGSIILVAHCRDGVGDSEFERYLKMGPKEVLKRIEMGETVHVRADIVATAFEKAGKIYVKSDLPPDQLIEYGLTPVKSVDEALKKALADAGKDARILCLPQGPYVAPVLNGATL
jgi:nickel-dependent lactate racemase